MADTDISKMKVNWLKSAQILRKFELRLGSGWKYFNFNLFSVCYHQIKVADLKKELKNRGKSTAGNKTELTERLQAALIGKLQQWI